MENMGYLLQAMWLVIESFFIAIYGALNLIGFNYRHYIAYTITGILLGSIFAVCRRNGIWFGREGGKLLGMILYVIVCAVITPIINLFS